MTSTAVIPARVARRVLLSLQALDAAPPSARGTKSCTLAQPVRPRSSAAQVTALVERLGYVQIDSINVIDRAHHLILSARLDGFRPAHLAHAIERRRDLFEHWTHDACVIPTRWYPHWHHRFARYAKRDRTNAWWRERFGADADRIMRRVLARVTREGPLRARDFIRAEGERREPGGWWNWHPEKAALEHLWRCGRLAVAGRARFEKIYDLSERVHADAHGMPASESSEHLAWLARSAIDRLGFATERELAAFWSAAPLPEIRGWVNEAVVRGELERVSVEPEGEGKPTACVAPADWRERFALRGGRSKSEVEMLALAPFDPIIRDRARALRLFAFDYRFEAFTPAAKRRYGYYVMPLLEGDRLVGRIDPKFDRDAGVLEIRGPWWEPGIKPDRARRARLDTALNRLAQTIGAGSVQQL